MSMSETQAQRNTRVRSGRIILLLSIAFWIASAGGIILMININK